MKIRVGQITSSGVPIGYVPTADGLGGVGWATVSGVTASGGGDMYKSVYDTNDNGIVDNSEALGGYPSSYFAISGHSHGHEYYLAPVDGIESNPATLTEEELAVGKRYIIVNSPGGNGVWEGHENQIATKISGDASQWEYYTGQVGDTVVLNSSEFPSIKMYSDFAMPPWVDVSASAGNISVDTTNFSNNLSSSDTSVQIALETLDQLVITASGGGGTPASTVTNETTWGITPAVGTSTAYARADHTHGTPPEPTVSGTSASLSIFELWLKG